MKKSILLVHRDLQLFLSVESWLRKSYVLVPEENLYRAVATAVQVRPSLIVLAFYEEGMDYALNLRQLSYEAKVLVWSGYTLDYFEDKSLAAGAAKCVEKASGSQRLLEAIEKLTG